MKEPKPPCLECDVRRAGCHAKCFKYTIFKAALRLHKQSLSDYWHRNGFDPAVSERNRQIRVMLRKKGK